MSGTTGSDSRRHWWLPLVVIALTMASLWFFQRLLIAGSTGDVGLIVGFFLGVGLTVLLEDYVDHHTE